MNWRKASPGKKTEIREKLVEAAKEVKFEDILQKLQENPTEIQWPPAIAKLIKIGEIENGIRNERIKFVMSIDEILKNNDSDLAAISKIIRGKIKIKNDHPEKNLTESQITKIKERMEKLVKESRDLWSPKNLPLSIFGLIGDRKQFRNPSHENYFKNTLLRYFSKFNGFKINNFKLSVHEFSRGETRFCDIPENSRNFLENALVARTVLQQIQNNSIERVELFFQENQNS